MVLAGLTESQRIRLNRLPPSGSPAWRPRGRDLGRSEQTVKAVVHRQSTVLVNERCARYTARSMDLATRFRELRVRAGLTKTALARPRYTVSYVSQIESGRRTPSREAMEFFAERLSVTPRFLATGIPDGLEDELRYRLEEARRANRGGG